MLATLQELTAIGTDSLFRTSASRGEAAAFELVAQQLGALPFLAAAGLEIERQPFRTYLGSEAWEVRLVLQESQGKTEVTAGGITSKSREAFQSEFESIMAALRKMK